MTTVEVFASIDGRDVLAGRLYTHQRRGTESATFTYSDQFLAEPGAYSLDPVLPLVAGALHTPVGRRLFNAFTDSAPDRWGRNLIDRQERLRGASSGSPTRRLREIDYLLGVRDDLRQGALRFRDVDSGAFVAVADSGVPVLRDLTELLDLASRADIEDVGEAELLRLVRAGSSLGGARPKTHVRTPDGQLAIAKFPSSATDTWDVTKWEKVALDLARRAGIEVPKSELIDVSGRAVLISYRFDRTTRNTRIGYTSALTMLEAADGDQRSYLEIAEVIEERSLSATADLKELWRRMAFTVLISNTDDHLRNHAFLHTGGDSWRLSPAFDLNPNADPGPKILSTAITEFATEASVAPLLEVAQYFRLDRDEAETMLRDMAHEVGSWRSIAKSVGLSTREINHMEPAFVHEAAAAAASL